MNRIKICDSSGTLLKYLYQWDAGQNVVISGIESANVTEVHFSHIHSDDALVVEPHITESGIIASVPNVLLQQATPIMLYIVCDSDPFSSRTICAGKITVVPRAKPADYTYTETEVLDYRALNERLKALEDEINRADLTGVVKFVNGTAPDENGNVEIETLPDELEQVEMLIEADMLPAVHDTSGAILTDENGNIILRY